MRARVVASAALAALAAVVLAGCNFITPMATQYPYDASDGLSVEIGDVHVLNALVLTEDGVNASLMFTALNSSGEAVDLTVQYDSDGERTDLSLPLAQGSNDFGFGEGPQVYLENIGSGLGGLLPVYFQYGEEPGKQLMLQVLDGGMEPYGDYLPQTPTPTPTPDPTGTGEPAPDPTETPAG